MTTFQDKPKATLEILNILDTIQKLPKTPCSRCGTIYRGEREDFICSPCLEKEEKLKKEKKLKEERIKILLNLSNIPKRYRNAQFKPKTETQNIVAKYLVKNFIETPLNHSCDILLFGSIGTGKTYLSSAFAIEAIYKKRYKIRYITEYELLLLYFEKDYKSFREFRDSEILILDEIGKRVLVSWQREQLEEFLSHRYNEMLPTIYITNLEQNAFKEFLGDRLADRLRENRLKRFAFNGESLRGLI